MQDKLISVVNPFEMFPISNIISRYLWHEPQIVHMVNSTFLLLYYSIYRQCQGCIHYHFPRVFCNWVGDTNTHTHIMNVSPAAGKMDKGKERCYYTKTTNYIFHKLIDKREKVASFHNKLSIKDIIVSLSSFAI